MYFLSTFVDSINVFDCCLSGVVTLRVICCFVVNCFITLRAVVDTAAAAAADDVGLHGIRRKRYGQRLSRSIGIEIDN